MEKARTATVCQA